MQRMATCHRYLMSQKCLSPFLKAGVIWQESKTPLVRHNLGNPSNNENTNVLHPVLGNTSTTWSDKITLLFRFFTTHPVFFLSLISVTWGWGKQNKMEGGKREEKEEKKRGTKHPVPRREKRRLRWTKSEIRRRRRNFSTPEMKFWARNRKIVFPSCIKWSAEY